MAGDVHMNQFPPVLLKLFGEAWFERGNLSLRFKNATIDREEVRVFAEPLAPGAKQTRVWMERHDGLLVCSGTAALCEQPEDRNASLLRSSELRPCDPAELKILQRLAPGTSLGVYEVHATPDKQFHRFDTQVISDPAALLSRRGSFALGRNCRRTGNRYRISLGLSDAGLSAAGG